MSTQNADPHHQNIAELLDMIREIGGIAVAFSAEDAAALATRLASLPDLLATHTIMIGMVPHSPTQQV